jgi:hypothetical protein
MQHVNQGKNRDASVLIKYDLFTVRALKKASVIGNKTAYIDKCVHLLLPIS